MMDAPPTACAPPSILLVEDDPYLLELLVMLVESWGWQALAASSVGEATGLMASHGPPSAVVVDYRLAEVEDGLMVIEAMRQMFGDDIPALIMTGDPGAMALRQIPDGGVHLLRKPLHPQHLQRLVNALCQAAGGEAV